MQYIFVGTSLWTYGTDNELVVFNENERKYLQGVVGIALPRSNDVEMHHFEARLQALQPTLYPPYHNEALVSSSWHAYDGTCLLASKTNAEVF